MFVSVSLAEPRTEDMCTRSSEKEKSRPYTLTTQSPTQKGKRSTMI